MATTIKLKNGSGAPLAGDLVQGEPALDLTNKRLYTEDSGGTVIEVGTNPTSLTTGTFTSTGIDDNATSTAITIDSSENVGIGPSTVGQALLELKVNGSSYAEIEAINFGLNFNMPLVLQRQGGNVGIGTSSPSTYDSRANNLVVGDSGDAGITIFSGASNYARLQFAPSGDTGLNNGLIGYDNANDKMSFATAGSDRMAIDASGNVGYNGKLFSSNDLTALGGLQLYRDHATGSCYLYDTTVAPYSGPLIFGTSNTERMRILSSGGITFNGDTATANALDDYEEGTFTPTHSGNNMGGTASYTKIGRSVTVVFDISVPSGSATSATISGLPFNVSGQHGTCNVVYASAASSITGGYVELNNNNIIFIVAGGTSATNLVAGDRIIGAAHYFAT